MLSNERLYELQLQERQQEIDQIQLVHQAEEARRDHPARTRRVLFCLGCWLEKLGSRLQQKFAEKSVLVQSSPEATQKAA